jgi:AraC-like DNA-binding protein
VEGDDADLRGLAASLGFSSHSHFTSRFRRAFGITPSCFRRPATGEAVRELARKLREAGPACRGARPAARAAKASPGSR